MTIQAGQMTLDWQWIDNGSCLSRLPIIVKIKPLYNSKYHQSIYVQTILSSSPMYHY